MDRILREIEGHQWSTSKFGDDITGYREITSSRRAVAYAANTLARDLNLQGIIVPTDSGHTAAVLSASRPASPLLGVSSRLSTCQKLSLHWGIIPFQFREEETNDWRELSQEIGRRCKLTKTGNKVLLVSGFNDDELLNEPVMKIIKIK